MDSPIYTPQTIDAEHLNLLSIFHWVYGGIQGVFSLIPIIHFIVGLGMMGGSFATNRPHDAEVMRMVGVLFVGLAIVIITLGMTAAVLTILSGVFIQRRQYRTFSMVIAALSCLMIPFGTVLGIFTLMVLSRESVRRLYAA